MGFGALGFAGVEADEAGFVSGADSGFLLSGIGPSATKCSTSVPRNFLIATPGCASASAVKASSVSFDVTAFAESFAPF